MNDNPKKEDIKRAKVDAARRYMSAKTDDERKFYKYKLDALKETVRHDRFTKEIPMSQKSFKQFVKEDWKRSAFMGAAATAAGALTAKAIGFPVVAGAAIAGGHYLFSKSGLRKDLRHKKKKTSKYRKRKWLEEASIQESKNYEKKREKLAKAMRERIKTTNALTTGEKQQTQPKQNQQNRKTEKLFAKIFGYN